MTESGDHQPMDQTYPHALYVQTANTGVEIRFCAFTRGDDPLNWVSMLELRSPNTLFEDNYGYGNRNFIWLGSTSGSQHPHPAGVPVTIQRNVCEGGTGEVSDFALAHMGDGPSVFSHNVVAHRSGSGTRPAITMTNLGASTIGVHDLELHSRIIEHVVAESGQTPTAPVDHHRVDLGDDHLGSARQHVEGGPQRVAHAEA